VVGEAKDGTWMSENQHKGLWNLGHSYLRSQKWMG
jgi:hypothetical protein